MARRRSSRKRSGGKLWIQGAVKKPGQLHRDLGVPQGKKIPAGKLRAAAKRKGKVGQRARFALNVRKLGGRRRKRG
jgi:hypothetical protein